MTQKRHHNRSSRDLDLDLNFFVFWYNLPPANKAGAPGINRVSAGEPAGAPAVSHYHRHVPNGGR
jgi:hypothetical protein